jgi:hypothetical protein
MTAANSVDATGVELPASASGHCHFTQKQLYDLAYDKKLLEKHEVLQSRSS